MSRNRVLSIIAHRFCTGRRFPCCGQNQAGNDSVLSKEAAPKEVASLIKTLGGRAVVHTSPTFDAEYAIPDSVEIFGRPVTKSSIHRGMKPGGAFTEYGALFSGESIATVGRIAGIVSDAAGHTAR